MSTTIYERIRRRDLAGLIRIDEATGCWIWQPRRNEKGYGLVDVPAPAGGRTTRRAHRLVFEAYTGIEIPAGLHGLHMCDTPECVNYAHVALGTDAANKLDAAMKRAGMGRHAGVAA